MPDGTWMQLQITSEAQVTITEQLPASGSVTPASPFPVLTMEIPDLDNIAKKLETMLLGQQKADLANFIIAVTAC